MADIITVTALNQYVKTLLECDAVLPDVALRGEISNFVNHFKTGHFYFTLKDEKCSVKAVMFRSNAQRLSFVPQNGMRMIVRCRVSLFERDGSFQIYVDEMFPDGIGAMQLAFDQLKERLEKEGLFDITHKQPIPAMPRCVGVVTSKTGAALQDILNVTQRRCPNAHLLLSPANVQGQEAAIGIVQALHLLEQSGKVDVIIIARGGGSIEDLWVLNDEQIARAVYHCKIPVVSAIGHEIDFSILDFVADLRAPTPSAAAEIVMPDLRVIYEDLCKNYTNICKEIQNKFDLWYNKLNDRAQSVALGMVRQYPQEQLGVLEDKKQRLQKEMQRLITQKQTKLQHVAALAHSFNPYDVLARGYSVATKNNVVIKDSKQVQVEDVITLKLMRGTLQCSVLQRESEETDA